MYKFLKILAFICIIIHTVLIFVAVTDWFNLIFIGFSIIIMALPKKYWGAYILPSILVLAGTLAGGYLLAIHYLF